MDSEPVQSLRLFYALWPDDVTRDALAKLQAGISGRKTSYENLHLTLAFLGDQTIASLPVLKKILANFPQQDTTLTLDRIGYFPKSRIAWAGPHAASNALFELRRCLTSELIQANFTVDTRAAFKPHVTLARDATVPDEAPFEPIHWHARHVCLVASSAEPDGVRYRILASNG